LAFVVAAAFGVTSRLRAVGSILSMKLKSLSAAAEHLILHPWAF
jgi:hypothetical protein